MTKNEIITIVSEYTSVPADSCESVIDSFIDEIKKCLMNGDKLMLKGFMSFEVCERAERAGRNPQTNEVVIFPASKAIKCKISRALKEAVNGK